MKSPKNYKAYKDVEAVIEGNLNCKQSTENGLFVLAIYKKGKKATSKVLVNGFSLEELDVVIRDVYARIYGLRKKDDKKLQALDKKFGGK